MNLTPLFEGQNQEKNWQTIKENMERIAGRLASSKDHEMQERIELLEYAVRIVDKDVREAFVRLIGKWFYGVTVRSEAYKDLHYVNGQIDSLTKKAESSPS